MTSNKMKSSALLLGALSTLLSVTACKQEQSQEPLTTAAAVAEASPSEFRAFGSASSDLIEFVGYASVPRSGFRSAASYEGGDLQYYWTRGDHVWIHDPAASMSLVQDVRNDIESRLTATRSNKTRIANFSFPSSFNGSSYHIRYTGTGNTRGDQVVIRSRQEQAQPNEAMHIGTSGDCGTAIATRRGSRFDFTLVRKAAYVTFTPYNSLGALEGAKITQIKVTSGNLALNGTFPFDDDGLKLSARPSATAQNKSSLLVVKNFSVPKVASASANAATLVIAPGAYRNVTIEYTIEDKATGVKGTITKQLASVTFAAGQHRLLSHDLGVNVYDDKYYMWDAKQEYWFGQKRSQPRQNFGQNGTYPKSKSRDPQRWFSTAYFNGGTPVPAVNSARSNPNVNETHWYVEANAYWDDKSVWVAFGHLHKGGVWVRTQQSIRDNYRPRVRDFKRQTYNYYDFTTQTVFANHSHRITSTGRPASERDFFFLPALGYYTTTGQLKDVGLKGYYWTSSPEHNGYHTAYALNFDRGIIQLYGASRDYGFRSWQVK